MLRDMAEITAQETLVGNIRALKARRRVSDGAFGEALGLSRTATNERLNLKVKFQIEEVQAAADFFGVPLEQLLAAEPSEAAS